MIKLKKEQKTKKNKNHILNDKIKKIIKTLQEKSQK
jgi:hypothetical protein